jgi:hypothetical protein
MLTVSQNYAQCFGSTAVFNIRWYSQFNAILNIVRTLFITFALGFAMITFSKDAQRLVLRPIERMLRKVSVPDVPSGSAPSRDRTNWEADSFAAKPRIKLWRTERDCKASA